MPEATTNRDEKLDNAIADYMRALALGHAPTREDWLGAHPDLAADLTEFLADRDRLERWAGPLRAAAGKATVAGPDDAAEPVGPGARLRYFGDYELIDEIAHGGMGVVFRARQLSLNRPVALKMILAGANASAKSMQRFHAEAEAAAALDHPGIVPIYEIGDCQGQPYFSMKLIEGRNLKQHLPELRLSARRGVQILAKVARAVHYAHQHGIIHRDLKPSNILIDSQGEPHLTDFGLARRTGADDGITHTGDVLGTPHYMAPEQAAGRKGAATTLADVYSLGAILYELLTGVVPFPGDDLLETLRRVREDEVPPPRQVQPTVDRDLEAVCMKCLAKDPQERYATAAELADDLERWLTGVPLSVRPEGLFRQVIAWLRRNIRTAVWTTTVGLLGGGLGTLLFILSNVNPLIHNAQKAYQNFPSVTPPTLLRYWPNLPDWVFPLGSIVGIGLMLGMGPAVIALTRPRRSWNDLTSGLSTGFVAGLASFLGGFGWIVALMLTVVSSIDDLTMLGNATKAPVAPALHSSDVFLESYPDLKDVPPDQRGGVFLFKIVADQVSGTLIGVWWGMLFSFLIIGGGATIQTLVAGYLWRRSGRFWHCLTSYFELSLSVSWLMRPLFSILVGNVSIGYELPLDVLFFGLAFSGVWKRWPLLLRLVIYGNVLSLWNAARLDFVLWTNVLAAANVIMLLIYLADLRRRRAEKEVNPSG